MERLLAINPSTIDLGDASWELLSTPANAFGDPAEFSPASGWIAACVPGTVAAAWRTAGVLNAARTSSLGTDDHWYRARFSGAGPARLCCEGLATIATVWLNGHEILSSRNMFQAHALNVELCGDNEIVIRFAALDHVLEQPASAGRWRPRMITPSSLRHVRTSVLGHMPGWCPPCPTVGPWRPIHVIERQNLLSVELRPALEGTTGILDIGLETDAAHACDIEVSCAGTTVVLQRNASGHFSGRIILPDVELWWPHTHGAPRLYEVTAHIGETDVTLGRTGFRRIEVDHGNDGRGFALSVNGVPVFCRGAVWASADLVAMPCERDAYLPWLQLARDAGMNMIRIPGTTVYEAGAFYDLCDELGLFVWQDFMFANFDYPASDAAFRTSVETEARQFLSRTAAAPCLAVLCGGSEVYQQAAMLGLPERKYKNPLFDEILPRLIAELRPDVPYVTGSPSGGVLPFVVDEGVGHYWGVGGYKRPLNDARQAGVRFASECLALANVPSPQSAPQDEAPITDITDPRWKTRVPRDVGSSWDFEDIRDHYLEVIFGQSAASLRYANPERYLDLSRATQAIVMEHVFTEWLRPGSPAKGGLVLMLQDFAASAGWGLISSCRTPKSPWYALRRLFRPLRVSLTDEGVNGLGVHLANETGAERDVVLRLSAWRDGRTQVLTAKRPLRLPARHTATVSAYDLIGSFFDISYAYRFNAPQHDATIATLHDATSDELLSQSFHFPLGHHGAIPEGSLTAQVEHANGGWVLILKGERLARFVNITAEHYLPEDDWFHLAPRQERRIPLQARNAAAAPPRGRIRALNMSSSIAFEAKQ